ncbi:hypothetical protein OAU50_03325 [Planctomycetota bacterium]|nr:hypothetical protein [Planctomycetota bacterium]
MSDYKSFGDKMFSNSFIVNVTWDDWPNNLVIDLWLSEESRAVRLTLISVMECHFALTSIGPIGPPGVGFPVEDIYQHSGEEAKRWIGKYRLFSDEDSKSFPPNELPIVLTIESHLLGNRKFEDAWDRDCGMYVACRDTEVSDIRNYQGPTDYPHRIPSG